MGSGLGEKKKVGLAWASLRHVGVPNDYKTELKIQSQSNIEH